MSTTGSREPVDPVDEIQRAWNEELPHLDVRSLAVFSRITRISRHLDHLRNEIFAEQGLEGWSFDVLAALRRSGEPYELTAGQLIKRTLVSSGTMTNRITRLLSLGLVTRREDHQDRRIARIALTLEGTERVDAAMAQLINVEQELLHGISPAEQGQLTDLLHLVYKRIAGRDTDS